jgi:two-component system NtrC family sensor kinase
MASTQSPPTVHQPRRRSVWNRLSFRLGMGLCLGAAPILLLAASWNLRTQRIHLTQIVRLSGENVVEVIRSATRHAMLDDNPQELQSIIETIVAQEGVDRIRVFDKRGYIRSSTTPEEKGGMVDTNAEQCFACHEPDQPLDRLDRSDRMRVFQKAEGERILAIIAPIRNEPACTNGGCHVHPASQRVLGVLDVHLSLAMVDQDIVRSERQLLLGVLWTAAALLTLAWLLGWRLVLRPVRRLTSAAARARSGDFTMRLASQSRDEIGDMGRSWNSMAHELGRARSQLEEWGQGLEQRVKEKTGELERAHEQMIVVEKMASLGKLAAVVAHEINNPLTGIATFARLLRRKQMASTGPESADNARVLKMMEDEAVRCGNIVRNLLLFSRTPAPRLSEQDIPPILERCELLLQHPADLENISLSVQVEGALPRVTCDSSQIQQLVLALAMNALEATPSGGAVVLSARLQEEGTGLHLEISDTGRGIPRENLDKIYEPFFSTKEGGTGVGLGLAVVYGIVNRHHGRIEVRSEPGVGTVFRIHLPLRQPSEPDETRQEDEVKVP